MPAGLPNETGLGLVNFLDISAFDLDWELKPSRGKFSAASNTHNWLRYSYVEVWFSFLDSNRTEK